MQKTAYELRISCWSSDVCSSDRPFQVENGRGSKPAFDVVDAKTGEVGFAAGHKISPRLANKAARDGLDTLPIPTEEIFGRYSAYDLVNDATGEIYIDRKSTRLNSSH